MWYFNHSRWSLTAEEESVLVSLVKTLFPGKMEDTVKMLSDQSDKVG